MTNMDGPLVGGKNEQRELLSDYRLDDGAPLHFALFDVPENGYINNDIAREAKLRLESIFKTNPEVIRGCAGKPASTVRSVIEATEKAIKEEEQVVV